MKDENLVSMIEQYRDSDYNKGVDAGRELERNRMLSRIADLKNQKFFENKKTEYKVIEWVERVLDSE